MENATRLPSGYMRKCFAAERKINCSWHGGGGESGPPDTKLKLTLVLSRFQGFWVQDRIRIAAYATEDAALDGEPIVALLRE